MEHTPNMDKIMDYLWEASASALESMMLRKQDLRDPEASKAAKNNLKILCMLKEDDGYSEAGDTRRYSRTGYSMGDYDNGGNSYRSRHLVRAHYSRDGENTITRMMDAADPREREVLEQLMRRI